MSDVDWVNAPVAVEIRATNAAGQKPQLYKSSSAAKDPRPGMARECTGQDSGGPLQIAARWCQGAPLSQAESERGSCRRALEGAGDLIETLVVATDDGLSRAREERGGVRSGRRTGAPESVTWRYRRANSSASCYSQRIPRPIHAEQGRLSACIPGPGGAGQWIPEPQSRPDVFSRVQASNA
ncbi:hypothetical protein GLOTRDRAFT_132883 [Gloeophyllum trabeum ATCC 11539]|uniref:Uncharacterized protein n=1 Tax=Gloeophyllum trabeum (strain ATCC 11539 / FP-39264 / Madison 617) TaxID=670483 RepID=S7RBC1_GLOTA|nr:uncharacterized protein GLOTRDRAFT_132883 [Gloeophyllum trabeum ATCC 11539]EPQ51515.1 hypothetical protein GLOTRDRAFT_132883 [Gloeophyllum trabeum ATCC 11539]